MRYNFYANSTNGPSFADVYTKNGKAYFVDKEMNLVGVRTQKVWGNAAEEINSWPSSPRILVISGGEVNPSAI